MSRQDLDRCVTGARTELSQVRQWLLLPSAETLEACPPALTRAAAYVNELSSQIDPSNPDPELVQPLLALSKEIRAAQRLLHQGGAMYFARIAHAG
jgi:hypothetical protein